MPQTNPTRSHGHTRRGKSGGAHVRECALCMPQEARGQKQKGKLGGILGNLVMIALYLILGSAVIEKIWHVF